MISEAVYYHYVNALLEGNKAECVQIIADLLDNETDIKSIYNEIFQKSMYRIGHLWEKDRLSVAKEHEATKITESLLNLVYPKIYETEKTEYEVVITCIEKEFHEIGPRIVSDYFELNGWHSTFLGSNTPQQEVLDIIEEKNPDVVGVSNTFYINIARLMKLTQKISTKFPDQQVILGGQALNNDSLKSIQKNDNIKVISNLEELDIFIAGYKK